MATDDSPKNGGPAPSATLADEAPPLEHDAQPTTVHQGVVSSPWDDKTTVGRDVPPPRLRTAAEMKRDALHPWDEPEADASEPAPAVATQRLSAELMVARPTFTSDPAAQRQSTDVMLPRPNFSTEVGTARPTFTGDAGSQRQGAAADASAVSTQRQGSDVRAAGDAGAVSTQRQGSDARAAGDAGAVSTHRQGSDARSAGDAGAVSTQRQGSDARAAGDAGAVSTQRMSADLMASRPGSGDTRQSTDVMVSRPDSLPVKGVSSSTRALVQTDPAGDVPRAVMRTDVGGGDWREPTQIRRTDPAADATRIGPQPEPPLDDWREPTRIRPSSAHASLQEPTRVGAQPEPPPDDWREPTRVRPSSEHASLQDPTRVEPAYRPRTSEQVPQAGGRKATGPLVKAAVAPPVPGERDEADAEAREAKLLGTMLGEYRVLEKLGSGGGGVVYRGEQPLIGRPVAIKVLHRELHVQDSAHARRFLEEARAVNAARHPNIIDVFSFGQTPDGEPYLVMELLEGEPLDKLLRRRGGLPVKEALQLALPVLGALSAAHAAGIVHRDLKPANIFIVTLRDGTTFPKLLDFGLARRGEAGAMVRQTSVGGTPLYIAPEQANGDQVGPQTDLYSFGCVMYALLTGKPPFTALNLGELIDSHRKLAPPPLRERAPQVPVALEALVLSLLEKDPAKRPASASEVKEALEQLRDTAAPPRRARSRPMTPAVTLPGVSEQALAPVEAEVSPPAREPARMPWVAVGVGLVVLILGAVAFALWGPRGEPPAVEVRPVEVRPVEPVVAPPVEPPVVVTPVVEPVVEPAVEKPSRSKHTRAQVKQRWRQLMARAKAMPREGRRAVLLKLDAARDCQRAPDVCWQELSDLEAKVFR